MTDEVIDENLNNFERRNLIFSKKHDHFHVTDLKDEPWYEKEELANIEMVIVRSPNQRWEESYGMPNIIKSERFED